MVCTKILFLLHFPLKSHIISQKSIYNPPLIEKGGLERGLITKSDCQWWGEGEGLKREGSYGNHVMALVLRFFFVFSTR